MKTWVAFAVLAVVGCVACEDASTEEDAGGPDAGQPDAERPLLEERWASSYNLNIAINELGKPPQILTSGEHDLKPSWSKTGDMFTFFRVYESGPYFNLYKTSIMVVNTDGTGLRKLTSGKYADLNTTWTRDGTNQILFNRYAAKNITACEIYTISPDGSPGDEVLLSSTKSAGYFEFVNSALIDGRLLVDRIDFMADPEPTFQTFLLTPNPGGEPKYEEVERPTKQHWHKLNLSLSETRVTYMLDQNEAIFSYGDGLLCYSDFDQDKLVISNQECIRDEYIGEYPIWNRDESVIIFDANLTGHDQIYAYSLADDSITVISYDPDNDSAFPAFEELPK